MPDMLRWLTAGESHGQALVATLEGLPAGVEVTTSDVAGALARRRLGYGRGARMKFEQDRVRLLGGVRHGLTQGGPVAIEIANTEWPKWETVMSADPVDAAAFAASDDVNADKEIARNRPLTRPRPGHADLVGMQKYGFDEARPVLERASARETAARVALGEIAVMATAMGLGVAVGRTPTPETAQTAPENAVVYDLSGYPDPGPPSATSWISDWQIDWLWLTVAVVAVVVYVRWALRLRARGDHWPLLRTISWVLGWVVFVYFTSGGPAVYGKILFSWHMVEHMGVAMIAPLLLVPGAPITLALRALPARKDKTLGPRELILATVHSSYLRVLANPAVAASLFFFSLAIFYYSPLFELAMRTHTGHVLMMVHFLLTGYMFTWVLIGIDPGPKRWSPLALLVVLFATISFHAFFGVILTQSTQLLAEDFFGRLDLSWMRDPIADQQRGGAIAWGVGEAPTLVLAIAVAWQWMRSDDRETARRDRAADRNGDAELEAYNRHLAGLSRED